MCVFVCVCVHVVLGASSILTESRSYLFVQEIVLFVREIVNAIYPRIYGERDILGIISYYLVLCVCAYIWIRINPWIYGERDILGIISYYLVNAYACTCVSLC